MCENPAADRLFICRNHYICRHKPSYHSMRNLIITAALLSAALQSPAADNDLYVYLKDGGLRVYPASVHVSHTLADGQLCIGLPDGSVARLSMASIDSVSTCPPQFMPGFTSFKFNNKFNGQLPTDVEGVISEDGNSITATVGAIGKSLTPSFKTDSEDAIVYIEDIEQQSKVSRRRFDKRVTYTVSMPGWTQMCLHKLSDEVWSDPAGATTEWQELELTTEMLYTNAPSNNEASEGLQMLLDGDQNTFFHSTWGSGAYEKLPLDECPYIDVKLNEGLNSLSFSYVTRQDLDNRTPQAWRIYGSSDGGTWQLLKELDEKDGVPQSGRGVEYHSPTISSSGAVRMLRLEMTRAEYKNYLCLAELRLYKDVVTEPGDEPELLQPAEYEYSMMPYGRSVTVDIDWLTDHADNVPRIEINTVCGRLPYDKTTYLDATITIDGAGVFPDLQDSVRIRGRGNSSWAGEWGKSPYRLKFASKVKPFGLTKGKSWVLQANAQRYSMLANATAMKIAQLVGTVAANHVIPVELYMNGEYRGSYIFTEQVGLSNNSVSLEDESDAVRLELDQYNEDWQFYESSYRMATVVKDPDLDEREDYKDLFSFIQDRWNGFTATVKEGGSQYEDEVDVEMLARYLVANEIVANCEIFHPKSTFLYNERIHDSNSPWVFGPVWDFDWAFGYEQNRNYGTSNPKIDFYNSMSDTGRMFFTAMRNNSDEVKRSVYKVYKQFMERDFDEMQDFIADYLEYARPSLLHNAEKWGDGNNYDYVRDNMQTWLATRAKHLFDMVDVYELNDHTGIALGDANCDGRISIADVVYAISYILGERLDGFSFDHADTDASGSVTMDDTEAIVALMMAETADRACHLRLPEAEAAIDAAALQVKPGEDAELPLTITVPEGNYTAAQFDITLPEGFTLDDVAVAAEGTDVTATFSALPDGGTRIALYSASCATLPTATEVSLLIHAADIVTDNSTVSISYASIVNTDGEEERMPSMAIGISSDPENAIQMLAGGNARNAIYNIDGRRVSGNSLPRGIYITGGRKIVR